MLQKNPNWPPERPEYEQIPNIPYYIAVGVGALVAGHVYYEAITWSVEMVSAGLTEALIPHPSEIAGLR